jgi:hypothetical protein
MSAWIDLDEESRLFGTCDKPGSSSFRPLHLIGDCLPVCAGDADLVAAAAAAAVQLHAFDFQLRGNVHAAFAPNYKDASKDHCQKIRYFDAPVEHLSPLS